MILPRTRFTVRRLMVAVAIVAVGMVSKRRYDLACYHKEQAGIPFMITTSASITEFYVVRDRYHREMERKYRRAMWYPFLPVEPDPLAPPDLLNLGR